MGRNFFRNPGVNVLGVVSDMPYSMSNQGSQGTGIYKQLVGYDFQLYKLASANAILTVGIESSDYAKLTVDQTQIDHNLLSNFAANKHFLQTDITNISPVLATGYLKNTTGTGLLSVSPTIPNTDVSGLGTMSTQNANGVAITAGTIIATSVETPALKFTTSPGVGKYLSTGADGTVSAVTPSFSATSTVVNVADYGAPGDSSDQTVAIQAALAACGHGDTLYFRKGKYIVTSTLSITKRINIMGDGQYSMLAMSGNNDLIHYDGTGGAFQRVSVRDMYLLSTSTTSMTSCLKFEKVSDVKVDHVIFSGADINLHLRGCLRSTFIDCQSETSNIDSFITQSNATYGCYMTGAADGTQSNVCKFLNCSFRQLSINYGVYVAAGNSEGGFSWYGGTFEATQLYGFFVSGVAQPFIISGIHCESTGGIYINSCTNGLIQGCFDGVSSTVVSSSNIVFDTCLIHSLSVDRPSSGGNKNCRQGSGTWSILSPNWYGGSDIPWSGQSSSVGGRANSMKNLCAGNLETWGGGLPSGFTLRGTPTLDQCGTALADTTKLFGDYCAKLTWGTGTQQGLEFTLPSDIIAGLTAEAVNIRNSEYSWTLSGSGTGEYYLRTSAGADPGIAAPRTVIINGTPRVEGTVGSLAANEWDYGNNDSLGYSTIYVRITGDGDPDAQAIGYVKYCDYVTPITAAGYFYSPAANKAAAKIIKAEHRYGGGSPSTITAGITETLPSDSWKKVICTFQLEPYVTAFKIAFGMIGESAGDIVYVDGIEIMTGHCVSDRFNDNSW